MCMTCMRRLWMQYIQGSFAKSPTLWMWWIRHAICHTLWTRPHSYVMSYDCDTLHVRMGHLTRVTTDDAQTPPQATPLGRMPWLFIRATFPFFLLNTPHSMCTLTQKRYRNIDVYIHVKMNERIYNGTVKIWKWNRRKYKCNVNQEIQR